MEEPAEYEEKRGRGRGRGRGRPRGRPRGSQRGVRGSKRNKIESDDEEVAGKAVADENKPPKPIPSKYDADCDISSLVAPTFTTLDQGPPAPMLRLSWDNPVNLMGEKVLSPRIHICDTCNKPVLIYGRMIPCKHVFCLLCAKGEDRVCGRCGDKVSRVEQTGLGSVYMCPFSSNKDICKRTYLSQRDLQAHIDHRHMKAAAAGKQKEEVKEDRLNHRDPRGPGGAADARNNETAARGGPDGPRQDLNRNDPRGANKESYDHGTYSSQQQQFQGQDAGPFAALSEGPIGGNRGGPPGGARGHTGGTAHHGGGGHHGGPTGHHGSAGHHGGAGGHRDHRDSGAHHGGPGGGHHGPRGPGGSHSGGGGGGPGPHGGSSGNNQAQHHIPVMTSSRTNLITVPLQQELLTDHNSPSGAPFNSHGPTGPPQHPPPSHMPPSRPPPSHNFNTPPPNQPPPHGPPPHSQPPPFSTSFNSNYSSQNPRYTFPHNQSGPPPQNPGNIPPIPYSGGPPPAGPPPPTSFSGRPPFEQQQQQQYSGNQWSTPPPQGGPPSHPPHSHPPHGPPPPQRHQHPPNAQSGSYYGRKSFEGKY